MNQVMNRAARRAQKADDQGHESHRRGADGAYTSVTMDLGVFVVRAEVPFWLRLRRVRRKLHGTGWGISR
jgi:hypothetical protein